MNSLEIIFKLHILLKIGASKKSSNQDNKILYTYVFIKTVLTKQKAMPHNISLHVQLRKKKQKNKKESK